MPVKTYTNVHLISETRLIEYFVFDIDVLPGFLYESVQFKVQFIKEKHSVLRLVGHKTLTIII